MNSKQVIKSVGVSGLLSFGHEGVEVDLNPLNVLIGPNGSGKSNFVEALRLICSSQVDFDKIFRTGGGIESWVWKGAANEQATSMLQQEMNVSLILTPLPSLKDGFVRHILSIHDDFNRPFVKKEVISVIEPDYQANEEGLLRTITFAKTYF